MLRYQALAAFADQGAFPLAVQDPIVGALIAEDQHDLAQQLSYEMNAMDGNSVTSHFNVAASGASKDDHRREVAVQRVAQLQTKAVQVLGYDPRGSDNEGGGAPPPPAAGANF